MTWQGESGASGSGLAIFTSDGLPQQLVGVEGQVTMWENGIPTFMPQAAISGSRPSSLNQVEDVDASSPSDNEFLGWNGSQWVPSVPGGQGGSRCYSTGLTTTATTSSATFAPIPGMSLTPGSGHYHCLFSSSAGDSKNGTVLHAAIFLDGVELFESQRQLIGQSSNRGNFNCQAVAIVDGTQTVSVEWFRDGTAGTASMDERLLILIECEKQ